MAEPETCEDCRYCYKQEIKIYSESLYITCFYEPGESRRRGMPPNMDYPPRCSRYVRLFNTSGGTVPPWEYFMPIVREPKPIVPKNIDNGEIYEF